MPKLTADQKAHMRESLAIFRTESKERQKIMWESTYRTLQSDYENAFSSMSENYYRITPILLRITKRECNA